MSLITDTPCVRYCLHRSVLIVVSLLDIGYNMMMIRARCLYRRLSVSQVMLAALACCLLWSAQQTAAMSPYQADFVAKNNLRRKLVKCRDNCWIEFDACETARFSECRPISMDDCRAECSSALRDCFDICADG